MKVAEKASKAVNEITVMAGRGELTELQFAVFLQRFKEAATQIISILERVGNGEPGPLPI